MWSSYNRGKNVLLSCSLQLVTINHLVNIISTQIPYSGLFSWVEIFVKSSVRPPELNFVVLNFVAGWAVI